MTRRETLGRLCALPLLGLAPLRSLCEAKPVSVVLQWDWDGRSGVPVDYFEVLVSRGDGVASDSDSIVTQVAADARACEISLPGDERCLYEARVRSVNAQGSSALSAPINFRA